MKRCVGELATDGGVILFCAYNSVGYREQVREQLTGVDVAPLVPHSRNLLLLLEPTPYGSQTVPAADGSGSGSGRDARNIGKRL